MQDSFGKRGGADIARFWVSYLKKTIVANIRLFFDELVLQQLKIALKVFRKRQHFRPVMFAADSLTEGKA